MELELNRTHLTGYEAVLDTTVFQEETLETIVPDACPDILRLVDTQGTILLKSKAAAEGRVTLTGTARLAVLYLPDGEGGPCRLEVNIPFSLSAEDKTVQTGCPVMAALRVVSADTRTANPRKIVTRVELAADLKVYAAADAALCTAVQATDGTVERLTQSHRPYWIAAVTEKEVSFQEELSVPAGRPAAEELLYGRVELVCHESKLIGSKLIFKGEASVRLLYRPVGGGLDEADFTLPFSQIAEVVGVGEEGTCRVALSLTAAQFTLGEDGRTVEATVSALAQAVVGEERAVEVLADAYSTDSPLRVEQGEYRYWARQAEDTARQTARQVLETGVSVRSVVDAACTVGRTGQSREGQTLRLTAQLTVTAVFLTEEGGCGAVSRRLEVSCAVDAPEDCVCLFTCQCTSLLVTPTADGVEVRLPVEFPYLCLRETRAAVVDDMTVDSAPEEEPGPRPSLVLRVLDEGERLWDVAKRYGTTIGDIEKANELGGEQPWGGKLLLIPRKR
jgi:hypothetical protein